MPRKLLVLVVLLAFSGSAGGALASGGPSDLARAKRATAQFRNIDAAKAAGYGVLVDLKGISCIDMPGVGAMGIHYVNGALVGDPAIVATKPEALVYAPQGDGQLELVAVEYVVIQSAWDALHASPPSLFGRPFGLTPAGNRFGLPAFYSLHAWIWNANPLGMFAPWNPNVTCTPQSGDQQGGNNQNGSNRAY